MSQSTASQPTSSSTPPSPPVPESADLAALVSLIIHDLRAMAHRQLAREHDHVTLQTTELVHEAYLRLAGHADVTGRGKAYFFAAAARAMRQVLVDASRRRNAGKRGDGATLQSLDDATAVVDAFSHELLDLDDALRQLELRDARAARVVECRFFAGMTVDDTAVALGISPRTVKSDWVTARTWLHEALHGSAPDAAATRDAGEPALLGTLDVDRAAALLDDVDHAAELVNIERYSVIRLLGRGGTGAVFYAHDPELGRNVAVKVLARWLCADPLASRRFLNEVRATSNINSSRIVTILRSGATDDGQLFIAMEYEPGVTLRARLSEGPLAPDDALRIALDITDGLGAAHGYRIIHRDIKPENILLTPRGACILDFGIAKLDGETTTRPGVPLGTAAYMSPEQARGDVVDHRTDFWSLGVVMHEMLSGVRPFRTGMVADVMRSVRSSAPTPVDALEPGTPPRLMRVVRCLLEKDRELRYDSAAALRTALMLCRTTP